MSEKWLKVANKGSQMYKKVWQTMDKHGLSPKIIVMDLRSDIDIEKVVLKALDQELGKMISSSLELRKEVRKLQIKLARRGK